ncbi:MAG: phospho-sugar mutase [Polyangiaceae bacterium]
MTKLLGSVADRARTWAEHDPDPETRAELLALVDAGDEAELIERMAAPLEFGTAGLRGIVAAGESRMNRAVVIRATRGLATTLLKRVADARTLPVIVGYDGRNSSRALAEETVAVLSAAQIPVRVFDAPAPTPLVAYAAKELAAQAAVVVTASHNPPEYNGYKVYAPNAAQIVPPWDTEIAAAIAEAGPACDVPRDAGAFDRAERVPDSLVDRYLDEVDAVRPSGEKRQDFTIVYTPMHGVGGELVKRAFARAGYRLEVVREQAEPDGNFPTVRFPNPEEPGALDLAIALAERSEAELILANDPDADRLAACVRTPAGRFVQLTGNQIGILLADLMLQNALPAPRPAVLSSIVSSPMLGAIASAYDAYFEQTLTGFKWIWNAALDLEASSGVRYCFGYEEALGYSVGRIVRDKDGISAALLFADLAAQCRARGTTVLEHLHALYRRHGLWVSVQKSVTCPGSEGVAQIAGAMQRLRQEPPSTLADVAVLEQVDYREGAEHRPRWLAATDLIALSLADQGRVLVRPSGTEPKLKIYVDLRGDLGDASVTTREDALRARATEIAQAVVGHIGL